MRGHRPPPVIESQGEARKGREVEKKRRALLKARILRNHILSPLSPFLPLRLLHICEEPIAPHSLPLLFPTPSTLSFPSPLHLHPPNHVHTHQNAVSQPKDRHSGREGKDSNNKAGHGMLGHRYEMSASWEQGREKSRVGPSPRWSLG